ncbi:hypothetical protein DCAR_0206684 [Daucus carota subsp. sativus]|uniref:Pentacotripeptide-repeat region of PRORP domain-containing protein n=2 Tax=Daucus carota subsp. sativus TaxID=79200 RepID=A0AAF0WE34_DAUCS|nr:hypothetical protein DCAR_0206684 [Daucus carota subsp. sativus]
MIRPLLQYTTQPNKHFFSRANILRCFFTYQDLPLSKIHPYQCTQNESISDHSGLDTPHEFIHDDDTPYIFTKFICSSAKLGSLNLGIQLHCSVVKLGFCSNMYVATSLVDMYGKCGYILHAQQMFDEMPHRNVVSFSSLITGYVNAQNPWMAIEIFIVMLNMGKGPTLHSVSGALVGCAQLRDVKLGAQVHGLCLKSRFEMDVVVGTSLIDMYIKSSDVEASRGVFDGVIGKNVVTWTSMVNGYSLAQRPDEAMVLVRNMSRLGIRANFLTYNCLLSSFSFPVDFDHFKQVHCCVIREGLESNHYLLVSLMTMYSRSSNAEDFLKICSTVRIWDQISWNGVIAGFANLQKGEEALVCYNNMRHQGINVDVFTLVSILKAMGIIAALDEGRQTHGLVFKIGYASNLCVQNGLVSMYAKCGRIADAEKVFFSMIEHDIYSWNSLLAGCAHNGFGTKALCLFEQMRKTTLKPDLTSYLAVLTACSHEGFLEKGLEYFDMMRNDDSLEPPKVEHYACIVNLFARAGYVHEAESLINSMLIKPGPTVYKALLSACQLYGNKEIAIRNATKLKELCPDDDATFVLISNVLATGGYWDDAAGLRNLMYDKGVKKQPAYSWILSNKNDLRSHSRRMYG